MGIAIVLVAFVMVWINQSGVLTADVLQKADLVLAKSDIVLVVDESEMKIETQKDYQSIDSISFMVVFNPETVTVDEQKITTPFDYTSSSGKDGNLYVTIFLGNAKKNKTLAVIPFEWYKGDITISDATLLLDDGNIDGLAIKKQ